MLEAIVYREMLRLSIKGYDCLCEGNRTGTEVIIDMMISLLAEATCAGIPVEKAKAELVTLVKTANLDKRIGETLESLKVC